MSAPTNTAFTLLNTSQVAQSSVVKYRVTIINVFVNENNVLQEDITSSQTVSDGLFAANIFVNKHIRATSKFSNLTFAGSTPIRFQDFVCFDELVGNNSKLLTN